MKRKKVKIEAWTNEPLLIGEGWNGVLTIIEPKYNCYHTNLCDWVRYKECRKKRKCMVLEPNCKWDVLSMVKKSIGMKITKKDNRKIARKLRWYFSRCRRIIIEIKEGKV